MTKGFQISGGTLFKVKMKKHPFRQVLTIMLVAALLALEWSSAHIHLEQAHQHDSGQHQHLTVLHQHQQASHHEDVLDAPDQAPLHDDAHQVVELDLKCTQCQGKLFDWVAVIPQRLLYVVVIHFPKAAGMHSTAVQAYLPYHAYASIRLRAPPVLT